MVEPEHIGAARDVRDARRRTDEEVPANFSTSAHNRVSYAMSALDKLANLRMKLGPAGSEREAFIGFGTLAQRDELVRLIRSRCAERNYDELGASLGAVVERCYTVLHEHLGGQDAEAAGSERARLGRIWMQRNLRHGTFLDREQFEKLFLRSDGTVPATFGTLPFVLALGLILDPAAFVACRPQPAI